MKKSLIFKSFFLLPVALLLLGSATACNEKQKETEEIAVTISTVAIKNFNLKADNKVLSNLDSVFFSIDLNNGVIFNADSLPVGTNISRLIPVITFMTTMSKAEIIVSGGSEDKTTDYLTNPNDSIDFTKDVTLKVTAYDQATEYTYKLKVNVHEQKPDSMMWDKLAVAKLPSRYPSPKAQGTVLYKEAALTLIEEENGEFTLAKSTDVFAGLWEKEAVQLDFAPDLGSLTATSDALWMLDSDGKLMTSSDGSVWSATGENWITLIGAYSECVLGVRQNDNGLIHCHYPAVEGISDPEVDPEFPLTGRSALVETTSKWTPDPMAFFVGGIKPDLSLSNATWAFDGTVWSRIDNTPIHELDSPVIVKYVYNRNVSDIFYPKEYPVWVVVGGMRDEEFFNYCAYYSYDNGVNWKEGTGLMDLPDEFPEIKGADGIVISTPLNASLTDYWKATPTTKSGMWLKPEYSLDGYDITWDCPYIYIFGGTGETGVLSDTIWRGVLARLAFTPIF